MVAQLAKHAVAESGRVIGICPGRNTGLAKSLDADEVSALYLDHNFHICM